MLKLRIPKSCIFFIILFCSVAAAGWGQTYTWVGGPTGGNWNTSTNWTPTGVPGPDDDVIIPYSVSINKSSNDFFDPITNTTYNFLRTGGTITVEGNFTINLIGTGYFLQNNGVIDVRGNFTADDIIGFTQRGGVITAGGNIRIDPDDPSSTYTDGRSFTQSGGTIVAGGEIYIHMEQSGNIYTLTGDGDSSIFSDENALVLAAETMNINGPITLTNAGTSVDGIYSDTSNIIALIADTLTPNTVEINAAPTDREGTFQINPFNLDYSIEYSPAPSIGADVWYSSDWNSIWPNVSADSFIVGRAGADDPSTPQNEDGYKGDITINIDSIDVKTTIITGGNIEVVRAITSGALTDLTISMNGNKELDTNGYTIGNLVVTDTGDLTLTDNLHLAGNMIIEANTANNRGGILRSSNYDIIVNGNWTQEVDGNDTDGIHHGTFVPGAGTVKFSSNTTFTISGNTTWNNLTCEEPGATIKFSNHPHVHAVSGEFKILGGTGANRITLTKLTNNTNPDSPDSVTDRFWHFNYVSGAYINFDNVIVRYSYAVERLVMVTSSTVDIGYSFSDNFNVHWGREALFLYSYTEDATGNGRIDRIRVQASAELNGDFSGLEIELEDGYKFTNCMMHDTEKHYMYILFEEKSSPDGNATPAWRIRSNSSLTDMSLEANLFPPTNGWITPVDTVWPRVSYSLMLPESKELFIQITEPVTGLDSGDDIEINSISGVGIQKLGSGEYISEYLFTAADIVSANDLLDAETFTFRDSSTVVDKKTEFTGSISGYQPRYPAGPNYDGYNYAGYTEPLLKAAPILYTNNADTDHRLTDILVSVDPVNSNDKRYFVLPVFAKDTSGGMVSNDDVMGTIRDFSGKGNLRDTDIIIQAAVNPDLAGTPVPSLLYGLNVPDTYRANAEHGPVGLWLPDDLNIVPKKNDQYDTVSGDFIHSDLYGFMFEESIYEADDTLEFFFKLNPGPGDISIARLEGSPDSPNWYRLIKPFSFNIKDVVLQRGGATILNNVINPTRGEKTYLNYTLRKRGQVTVQVFTMDGNLVQVLHRGSQSPGEYIKSWDGKNQGGRSVARGMYFIRIVGPDIDEIRKVMVVK